MQTTIGADMILDIVEWMMMESQKVHVAGTEMASTIYERAWPCLFLNP